MKWTHVTEPVPVGEGIPVKTVPEPPPPPPTCTNLQLAPNRHPLGDISNLQYSGETVLILYCGWDILGGLRCVTGSDVLDAVDGAAFGSVQDEFLQLSAPVFVHEQPYLNPLQHEQFLDSGNQNSAACADSLPLW